MLVCMTMASNGLHGGWFEPGRALTRVCFFGSSSSFQSGKNGSGSGSGCGAGSGFKIVAAEDKYEDYIR